MNLERFLLRLVVGGFFIGHGTQKLFGWFGGRGRKGTGQFFESLDCGRANSVIAWLIVRARLDADAILPPAGGRAPGWSAGLVVARRNEVHSPRGKPQPFRTVKPTRPG
jgi:putative oxidoreductase